MPTHPVAFLIGVAILLIVVWDAFEVIILPRRVTRRFRLSRLFYKNLWRVWKFTVGLLPSKKVREPRIRIRHFRPPLSFDSCRRVGCWTGL